PMPRRRRHPVPCLALTLALCLLGPGGPPAAAADKPRAEPTPRADRFGDSLPPGAVARLGAPHLRHEARVTCVAFSPDGKRLASGGYDNLVRVWDVTTGKESLRLAGYDNTVYAIVFSPDGKLL